MMACITLCNPEHDCTLAETFALYLLKEEYLDLTFVCNDKKIVRAHKIVFASVSPFVKELINTWKGPGDDIVITMAEVSHKTMKLIVAFLYDGMMKLARQELVEFRDVLVMLDITLPDAMMSPVLTFSAAYPPPPVRKLEKNEKLNFDKVRKARDNLNPQIIDTRTMCSSDFVVGEEGIPDTITVEDDPLNVPDFYFVPPTAPQSTDVSPQDHNFLDEEPTLPTVPGTPQSQRAKANTEKLVPAIIIRKKPAASKPKGAKMKAASTGGQTQAEDGIPLQLRLKSTGNITDHSGYTKKNYSKSPEQPKVKGEPPSDVVAVPTMVSPQPRGRGRPPKREGEQAWPNHNRKKKKKPKPQE